MIVKRSFGGLDVNMLLHLAKHPLSQVRGIDGGFFPNDLTSDHPGIVVTCSYMRACMYVGMMIPLTEHWWGMQLDH